MGQGRWGLPRGGALDAGPWGSRCPLTQHPHLHSTLLFTPATGTVSPAIPISRPHQTHTHTVPSMPMPSSHLSRPLLTFPTLSSKTQPKPYLPPPPESPPWLISLHWLGVFHGMYSFLDVLHSVLCVCSNLSEMSC